MLCPPTSGPTIAWRCPCVWNDFLFHSCTTNQAPLMSKSSPKGNESQLLDRNGGRKSGCVSSVHVD